MMTGIRPNRTQWSANAGARRHFALAAALVASLWLNQARAFSDLVQFPGATSQGGIYLIGDAVTNGDYIQLTPAAQNKIGSLVIDRLPRGQRIKSLSVTFDLLLSPTGVSNPQADGVSFNFGPDLFGSAIGEDGISTGLAVTFDTYDDNGPDTAPAIEVVYNGVTQGGASFPGTRFDTSTRPDPAYPDNYYPSLSFTAPSDSDPAQVKISMDYSDADGVAYVTVIWNGTTVLDNIPIDYVPVADWRIAYGARCGSDYQQQSVRNIEIDAETTVTVTVNSEFGGEQLTPVAGSQNFTGGSSQLFSAPAYVYLDRYFNTLSGSENDMRVRASYRARLLGGTFNGDPLSSDSTLQLDEDATVHWNWELEYLVQVNAGTENIEGLSDSSVTDPTNQQNLGRNFRPLNYNFNSAVYSSIGAPGSGLNVRYLATGYVMENGAQPPERFIQLSSGEDYLYATLSATALGAESYTIEFWARLDPETPTQDQLDNGMNVVSFGDEPGTAQLSVGFDPNNSNAFFITNNAQTYSAPAALTDYDWHFWAAVYDDTDSTLTLYQDGREISRETVTGMNVSYPVAEFGTVGFLGARPTEFGAAEGFFAGGVNNVRCWRTARTRADIRNSMNTLEIGAAGAPDLGWEVTFDTPPSVPLVDVDAYTGSTQTGKNGEIYSDIYVFLAAFNSVLPAAATFEQQSATVFPGFQFRTFRPADGSMVNVDTSQQGAIVKPVRVFWRWWKHFNFTADVSTVGLPQTALSEVATFPYFISTNVDINGEDAVAEEVAPGVLQVLDLWLGEAEPLTLGTVYRTADRRYSLSDITNQTNNFAPIGFRSLGNDSYDGLVAKSTSIAAVTKPGSLYYQYGPTKFRAQLAIGEGLDFSSVAAINEQLVPALPDDVTALAAVSPNTQPAVTEAPEAQSPAQSNGNVYAWDFVGQKFYPLMPGQYTISWPSADGSETFSVVVTADFPNVTEPIGFMEDADGNYLGDAPDYLTDYLFPGTAAFPESPAAHYRYLVSPATGANDGELPVDLDPSTTDRWYFERLAYSDQSTASVDTTGASPRFTESSVGTRSVLLFSYVPGSGIATGNSSTEMLAVRVVSSLDPASFQDTVSPQVLVADRITSSLDTASYGSGYIIHQVSNYNATLYNRAAAVGDWGPVFPVNMGDLFTTENATRFGVAYYEEPGADPSSDSSPPVGWPYTLLYYDDVAFPDADTAPVIYIASQLGSEGFGQSLSDPVAQLVFDPAEYSNLSVYNQPDRGQAGFNPNEEHALVAATNLAQMTGDPTLDIGQRAFFALQNDVNCDAAKFNATPDPLCDDYTSEPFVLAQFTDSTTGEADMVAYAVKTTRGLDSSGVIITSAEDPSVTIPLESFPARDPVTHLPTTETGAPVTQPQNPVYAFETVIFAGEPVNPFYPLNQVTGGIILAQNEGQNLGLVSDPASVQRTLWLDKNAAPWSVAGDVDGDAGLFEYRFWYPLNQDFWLGEGADAVATGQPVCWLPDSPEDLAVFTDDTCEPQPIDYASYWQDNYPVLKRGETMAYAGGEYQADNPQAPGLPGVIGWASAELVFDSETPGMVFDTTNETTYNARVMRLLDLHSVPFTQEQMPADLSPADPQKVSVVGARWYFTELTGSLGARFYFDPLEAVLVVRGRMNGLETGNPELTVTPIGVSTLETNRLSEADVAALQAIGGGSSEWNEAVEALAQQTNENDAQTYTTDTGEEAAVPPLISAAGGAAVVPLGLELAAVNPDSTPEFRALRSLGTGAVVVPNQEALTRPVGEETYITLVENNAAAATGAVTPYVVRLGVERYRGAVTVITPEDAFSEKVNLLHSADFGGETENIYYQWWMHDIAPLDSVSTPDDPSAEGWLPYQQGLDLRAISFEDSPTMSLSDKLFYVRYGTEEELSDAEDESGYQPLSTADAPNGNVTDGSVHSSSWRLINPGALSPDWSSPAEDPTVAVPYQWAGAANSPQYQASGGYAFVPQLLMGWVKRVLDEVNLYEARYSAAFNGDAPATFSSMLVEAGAPFTGPVALNDQKDYIENIGLIELYETVSQRATELNAGQPVSYGINMAQLLANTRLHVLYGLLAHEAYADAENSSLNLAPGHAVSSELHMANPWVHAFQNDEVPDLLSEKLALLRGTDYEKSYPVYNRLWPNYFRGLGEAAYNANYNITDVTNDGLIDENDALVLYPQGQGDAWGHYLSAQEQHYSLLRSENFDWNASSELYSQLGNVLEVDYLDEKTFARTAAARARAGLGIVKATYQDAYVADPDAQWQGYNDTADPERAWGVSDWAARAGQGAVFDWMVGNAILPGPVPVDADGQPLEGLSRLDRKTTEDDLRALAGNVREMHETLDSVNAGLTPSGLDGDAIRFGLDPFYDGDSWPRKTHFEQVYELAVLAGENAHHALEFVSATEQNLRRIADDTDALKNHAIKQDIEYRNRLIALMGTPYDGTIGAGQLYPEGYIGPDTLTYMYVDAVTVEQVDPVVRNAAGNLEDDGTPAAFRNIRLTIEDDLFDKFSKLDFGGGLLARGASFDALVCGYGLADEDKTTCTQDPYPEVAIAGFGESDVVDGNELSVELAISTTAQWAFKAPAEWGKRATTGAIQGALRDQLRAEIALERALDEYQVYLNKLSNLATFAGQRESVLRAAVTANDVFFSEWNAIRAGLTTLNVYVEYQHWQHVNQVVEQFAKFAKSQQNLTLEGGTLESLGAVIAEGVSTQVSLLTGNIKFLYLSLSKELAEYALEVSEKAFEFTSERRKQFIELAELMKELSNELQEEPGKRLAMAAAIENLDKAASHVRSLQGEADRLLDERAALNKMIAASAQRQRYGDMSTRLARDEAVSKYGSAMDNAVRYAVLAAKAFDYETSLSLSHPANPVTALEDLQGELQLGEWKDGTPRIGHGGLAETLAQLKANHASLKGDLGLNNPQWEASSFSLRTEAMRILPPDESGNQKPRDSESDAKWRSYLASTVVADLNQDPDFTRRCRPFADPDGPPQPGFKIEFSTEINSGRNFFGKALGPADTAYSSANFATRIRSLGVGLEGYDMALDGETVLAAAPRVYLVPAGLDVMRYSDSEVPRTRAWNVVNQRIPTPFAINTSNLEDPGYIPSVDSLNGSFADLVRYGDFRAYPLASGNLATVDPAFSDSKLFSRSVWNRRWILFIPHATLGSDTAAVADRFMNTVTDIRLDLTTFSASGM